MANSKSFSILDDSNIKTRCSSEQGTWRERIAQKFKLLIFGINWMIWVFFWDWFLCTGLYTILDQHKLLWPDLLQNTSVPIQSNTHGLTIDLASFLVLHCREKHFYLKYWSYEVLKRSIHPFLLEIIDYKRCFVTGTLSC